MITRKPSKKEVVDAGNSISGYLQHKDFMQLVTNAKPQAHKGHLKGPSKMKSSLHGIPFMEAS